MYSAVTLPSCAIGYSNKTEHKGNFSNLVLMVLIIMKKTCLINQLVNNGVVRTLKGFIQWLGTGGPGELRGCGDNFVPPPLQPGLTMYMYRRVFLLEKCSCNTFCPSVKTSCSPAENVNKTLDLNQN